MKEAYITIGDETETVGPGDVVAVPLDILHTMTAKSDEVIWAALWWEHQP